MSQDIKELRVGPGETTKRIMYLAKEFLLNNESIDVVAGTASASSVARSCEALVRRTETNIVNDRRKTRLLIRLKKTNQFAKLYEENEANRKRKEAEREEQKNNTPK